jgi:hypothetical protein
MGERDQITVMRMKVTSVPEFLPVVQGFVEQLAGQLNFKESQRLNLREGVGRACAQMMESGEKGSRAEMSAEETPKGGRRLTLVKYNEQGRQQ